MRKTPVQSVVVSMEVPRSTRDWQERTESRLTELVSAVYAVASELGNLRDPQSEQHDNTVKIRARDLAWLLESARPANPVVAAPKLAALRKLLPYDGNPYSRPRLARVDNTDSGGVAPPEGPHSESPPPAATPTGANPAHESFRSDASEGGDPKPVARLVPRFETLDEQICAHSYGVLDDWERVGVNYRCKLCSREIGPNSNSEGYEALCAIDPEKQAYREMDGDIGVTSIVDLWLR